MKTIKIEQLRTYMEQEGLDGFYIAEPANVRCISGYTGEDSYLFIGRGSVFYHRSQIYGTGGDGVSGLYDH